MFAEQITSFREEQIKELYKFKDVHKFQVGNAEFVLIIRDGVIQMLERLQSFCEFYAYSHGVHNYVMKIIEKLDPDQKYFKQREQRVLAPKDPDQQSRFKEMGKSI